MSTTESPNTAIVRMCTKIARRRTMLINVKIWHSNKGLNIIILTFMA